MHNHLQDQHRLPANMLHTGFANPLYIKLCLCEKSTLVQFANLRRKEINVHSIYLEYGFSGGSVCEESACNAGHHL